MNIHITDKELYRNMMENSLFHCAFGSTKYNVVSESSDTDYLVILPKSIELSQSFIWEHHNFQYVDDDGNDWVFTDIHNFIRNLITGDSTILIELIHDQSLVGSDIEFLYDNKEMFYTYSTLKSYLGYVKRDLKYAKTDDKRLFHAYRGILFFEMIVDGKLNVDLSTHQEYFLLCDIKNGKLSKDEKYHLISIITGKMTEYRESINEQLNNRTIDKLLSIENMKELDHWLIHDLTNKKDYVDKSKKVANNFNAMYDALENGITY